MLADKVKEDRKTQSQNTKHLNYLIGRNLKTFRRARGLTQSQVGRIIGVEAVRIYRIEKALGQISAANLKKIADCFVISISAFFTE